jgi:glycosyltransferase involved in cell wall biosynthesis
MTKNHPSKRLPVTVVIPVKNEEKNLSSCLAQLGWFSEVIVVDSGSTDRTRSIAERAGARVLNFSWHGGFPKKRNWVLLNYPFTTPWVFFLDADERVPDIFCYELSKKLEEDGYVGFWLNYRNYFLGKILAHGVPQKKLALFRVGSGLYERIDDVGWTDLDMEVHEHPLLLGQVGEISAQIDHFAYRSLHHFIARHNDYSTWEAYRFLQLGTCRQESGELTKRQKLKYRYIASWWFPVAYFGLTYFVRGGCLDGRPGLVYATLKAVYFYQVRQKIREIAGQQAKSAKQSSASAASVSGSKYRPAEGHSGGDHRLE